MHRSIERPEDSVAVLGNGDPIPIVGKRAFDVGLCRGRCPFRGSPGQSQPDRETENP